MESKVPKVNIPSHALVYIDILQVIHTGNAHRHVSFLEKYLSPKSPTFLPLSICVHTEPTCLALSTSLCLIAAELMKKVSELHGSCGLLLRDS